MFLVQPKRLNDKNTLRKLDVAMAFILYTLFCIKCVAAKYRKIFGLCVANIKTLSGLFYKLSCDRAC